MSAPTPSMPPGNPTAIPVDPSSGVWDRITNWVSENKAVVYTIAGVSVVVTGAGIVYYLSDVCLVNPASTLLLLLLPPTSWCGQAGCGIEPFPRHDESQTDVPPQSLVLQRHIPQAQQEGEEKAQGG